MTENTCRYKINNNALRSTVRKNVFENSMRILELCMEYVKKVLYETDFSEELIICSIIGDRCQNYCTDI